MRPASFVYQDGHDLDGGGDQIAERRHPPCAAGRPCAEAGSFVCIDRILDAFGNHHAHQIIGLRQHDRRDEAFSDCEFALRVVAKAITAIRLQLDEVDNYRVVGDSDRAGLGLCRNAIGRDQ